MFWERIDDLEALRIGIQSEIDSYNYYKEGLKYFNDKDVKDLLVTLANEEKKHRKMLEEQYSHLSGKRLLYINLPKKRRFLKPLMPDVTELDVLETAIEHERETRNFYEKAAQRTMDANGRMMFENLVKEEERHYELLKAEFNVRAKGSRQGKSMTA